MQPIFITGIGTGVGKTVVSAIVTQALHANYWKPIQAGVQDGTDYATVESLVNNPYTKIYKPVYELQLPASPHIAAKKENTFIDMELLKQNFMFTDSSTPLVIEGAGGLLVPINKNQFVIDIIKAFGAQIILVSQNYLGSINHSLLTAHIAKHHKIPILGWIFNDHFMNYEEDIVRWSKIQKIASIPKAKQLNEVWINEQAQQILPALQGALGL